MKKRDLIISPDGNDDGNEGWMIRYDPNGTPLGNRDEWERTLEETRELARDAEAGSVTQMRVGNRFVRSIWFLFSRQEKGGSESYSSAAKPDHRPPTLADAERALEDFYDVHALGKNPLAHALNLSRHCRGDDPTALALGYALQRALNETLDHVTGSAPRTIFDRGLRIEHYLHFRYRAEIGHNELADALNYHPRHLRRKREERIREFAEVLVALNPPAR